GAGPGLQDLLRRLGEPEAIAAAASDSAGDFAGAFAQPAPAITQPPAGRGPRRQRRLDVAAVMLTLGSVLLAPVSFVLALLGWAVGLVMLLLSPRWPRRAKALGAVTGTLALVLFGGLLAALAQTWNDTYPQRPGPFGWHPGGDVSPTPVLVTAAVVAVTVVGARLLRSPLSQPAGPGPATPAGRTAAEPAQGIAPEPAASARA